MNFILAPWHIALAAFCDWVNERQQQIIEFQNAQIEALLQPRRPYRAHTSAKLLSLVS